MDVYTRRRIPVSRHYVEDTEPVLQLMERLAVGGGTGRHRLIPCDVPPSRQRLRLMRSSYESANTKLRPHRRWADYGQRNGSSVTVRWEEVDEGTAFAEDEVEVSVRVADTYTGHGV